MREPHRRGAPVTEPIEWPQSTHFRDISGDDEQRASFLERFFDLVYVERLRAGGEIGPAPTIPVE